MTTKKNGGRGKLANFHGRKAAPFRAGHKRRAAVVPARKSTGRRKG